MKEYLLDFVVAALKSVGIIFFLKLVVYQVRPPVLFIKTCWDLSLPLILPISF